MKKLLTTAAICGLVVSASPAQAQVSLELGGFFKGYGAYVDQDDDSSLSPIETRELDILRNTEIHFTGETTLDNGLTVGAHMEVEADGGPSGQDSFNVQESYVYFSGGWGRVNFGGEDGAAYLLQVAAPSADSNVDGIRQYINSVNYAQTQAATAAANELLTALNENNNGLDYAQDLSAYDDKLTYLSPIMNGFQLGLSYTPDTADGSDEDLGNTDDSPGVLGAVYEGAVRYEGMFNNVGVILGAGYTQVDLESPEVAIAIGELTDDRTAWNVGLDLDIGPFGIGVSYKEDDYGETATAALGTTKMDDEETFVVGVDYTNGRFKLGASYMDVDNTRNIRGTTALTGVNSERWTAGVVYTYGPGMTFRGSISEVEHSNVDDVTGGTSVDATSLLIGTGIKF